MKILLAIMSTFCCCIVADAQVKGSYIYNTNMPYGVLDLRTTISSSQYYYLQENKTFSFRESSPGVRTNTFLDMTSYDSNPYRQGNLRYRNGTKDSFVMNYRLLFPNNYSSTYVEGYPMIVVMHGAIERANCYYNNCYHATPTYTVEANAPAAPTISTHKLLNNDHSLANGGKQHLDARNLSGTKLPNDPALPARAFSGFVLYAQMFNVWDSLQVQDVIRIVQLHVKKYKIDPNRIYIHGLSIGGYAVYEAIKRAPWLFAAALPMSAVREAGNIFKHNQQAKVVHIPLWVFQGAKDTNPTLSFTNGIVTKFRNAGAIVRYSVYSDLAHAVWNRAYGEPEFFSWMKAKTKSNLHAYKGNTTIVRSTNQFPKLMLAEGFFAYQWEKNGVIISATSNTYTATSPGTYRARFSRISSVPTASQWNKWSVPVTITETTTATTIASTAISAESVTEPVDQPLSVEVFPNPTTSSSFNLTINTSAQQPIEVEVFDMMGRTNFAGTLSAEESGSGLAIMLPSTVSAGLFIVSVRQGRSVVKKKVLVKN
jgi:dienelactone hydrolase